MYVSRIQPQFEEVFENINAKIQIAKNLLAVLNDEEIAERTELAIDVVKKLREEALIK